MIAVPRSVDFDPSRRGARSRVHREVALRGSARAVRVAPEEERPSTAAGRSIRARRRGRCGATPSFVERLDLCPEQAPPGGSPLVEPEASGTPADEGGADVGAAARREKPHVVRGCRTPSEKPVGGREGAIRSSRRSASRERVAARTRLESPPSCTPRCMRRSVPKQVIPASAAEGPRGGFMVRLAGTAVVEPRSPPRSGRTPTEAGFHIIPAGRREPEDAVARPGVHVQAELLQVLEQECCLARARSPSGRPVVPEE